MPNLPLPSDSESDREASFDTTGLPAEVAARLPAAMTHAHAQAARAWAVLEPRRSELNVRLRNCLDPVRPRIKRLEQLRALAQTVNEASMPFAACKAGCSHCCHIPVSLSALEAQLIGKAIGRKPAEPNGSFIAEDWGYRYPCPFLKDSRCSIYEHRPLSCRTHLNLDVDALLCRLVPGAAVPVPYMDMTRFQMAYIEITHNQPLSDIRAFFPAAVPLDSPSER